LRHVALSHPPPPHVHLVCSWRLLSDPPSPRERQLPTRSRRCSKCILSAVWLLFPNKTHHTDLAFLRPGFFFSPVPCDLPPSSPNFCPHIPPCDAVNPGQPRPFVEPIFQLPFLLLTTAQVPARGSDRLTIPRTFPSRFKPAPSVIIESFPRATRLNFDFGAISTFLREFPARAIQSPSSGSLRPPLPLSIPLHGPRYSAPSDDTPPLSHVHSPNPYASINHCPLGPIHLVGPPATPPHTNSPPRFFSSSSTFPQSPRFRSCTSYLCRTHFPLPFFFWGFASHYGLSLPFARRTRRSPISFPSSWLDPFSHRVPHTHT